MGPKGGGHGLVQLAAVGPHERQDALILACFCRTVSFPPRPRSSIARRVTRGGVCTAVSTGRGLKRHGVCRHVCCLLVSAPLHLPCQTTSMLCFHVCARSTCLCMHMRGEDRARRWRALAALLYAPAYSGRRATAALYLPSHTHTHKQTHTRLRAATYAHKHGHVQKRTCRQRVRANKQDMATASGTPGKGLDKAAGEMQVCS